MSQWVLYPKVYIRPCTRVLPGAVCCPGAAMQLAIIEARARRKVVNFIVL
jgi:hypothetical protein